MKHLPVKVECYAGSRADERPRRVQIEGRDYIVMQLLSSSIEQSLNANVPVRRFRVVTVDGWQIDLTYTEDGEWFLGRMMEIQTGYCPRQ